ncbi:MAG: hypothetical protein J6E31_03715, partial [Pyramidobacter sp.]|nr:hypothetical protein [Pyramidobacter sp.]
MSIKKCSKVVFLSLGAAVLLFSSVACAFYGIPSTPEEESNFIWVNPPQQPSPYGSSNSSSSSSVYTLPPSTSSGHVDYSPLFRDAYKDKSN